MKKSLYLFLFAAPLLFISCDYSGDSETYGESLPLNADPGQGNGSGNQSGLITAAEWNDLDNWDFWNNLFQKQAFSNLPDYWGFYFRNRVSVVVKSNHSPLANARVALRRNGSLVWQTKTDNFGKAELWADPFQNTVLNTSSGYSISVNGTEVATAPSFFENGANEINVASAEVPSDRVELAFIVDATGSMGDELEFLKDDLADVITRVQTGNSALKIYTASVFYRDQGDDYLVRKSDFTETLSYTVNFIQNQTAQGGGDYPEAVHTALKTALEELQWSDKAKTRIAFLLLDAPPHYNPGVLDQLKNQVKIASEKGIKLIPVTASGINKPTEFLMRFLAIATNGTYVFITDDSGIGNDHLEASVGEYQVEYLNDLMVRLINKYTE